MSEGLRGREISRRDILKYLGAGAVAAGSGKAIHNVLMGYDKNLKSQDLANVASKGFNPSYAKTINLGNPAIEIDYTRIIVYNLEEKIATIRIPQSDLEESRDIDSLLEIDESPVTQLVRDVPDIRDGRYEFDFYSFDDFFDKIREARDKDAIRPYTAEFIRGNTSNDVDPLKVEEFTGEHPEHPQELLQGFKTAFRRRTSYDVPRYLAGATTDNILRKKIRLRRYFIQDVDYNSLLSREKSRMFCYEYNYRVVEALHSVPAFRQTPPVIGAKVNDYRHKHVYTGVASVYRDPEDGGLRVPMTFVDYTRTTLYDDLKLKKVLGDDVNAYNSKHRADRIRWFRT